MAAFAFGFAVDPLERKLGVAVVIEADGFPLARRVTGLTTHAIGPLMHVLPLMTSRA